jgi:hypothetical protein
VSTYTFRRVRVDTATVVDVQQRDLPDDEAALGWMGQELLVGDHELYAFRAGETEPFARRLFGEHAEEIR